jgi:hypothetical protein
MKRIFTSLILAGAVFTANAQSVGLKAGVNFANIIKTDDDNFKTDYKTGFHAGVTFDIPLVDRLVFAPEVVFSQKGYETSGNSILGGDYENSITTNFIEIPILLKIKAASGFNIHLGPQVSFLTSTTTTFKRGSNAYQNKVNEDNDNLRKSLIGGVLGVGFEISPKASLIGRYALDLQKNNENGTSETPLYRNQVFQLGLGFKL